MMIDYKSSRKRMFFSKNLPEIKEDMTIITPLVQSTSFVGTYHYN